MPKSKKKQRVRVARKNPGLRTDAASQPTRGDVFLTSDSAGTFVAGRQVDADESAGWFAALDTMSEDWPEGVAAGVREGDGPWTLTTEQLGDLLRAATEQARQHEAFGQPRVRLAVAGDGGEQATITVVAGPGLRPGYAEAPYVGVTASPDSGDGEYLDAVSVAVAPKHLGVPVEVLLYRPLEPSEYHADGEEPLILRWDGDGWTQHGEETPAGAPRVTESR